MTYSAAERRDWLRTRMRQVNSLLVSYHRLGSAAVENVAATVYEPTPEELAAMGIGLDRRRREYIIDVAELAAVGNPFGEPQPGDRITENTSGLVCQVTRRGEAPCCRFTDHRRISYRIHTQVTSDGE